MPYPKRKQPKPPQPKWKLRKGQAVVLHESRTNRLLGNATYIGKATVYCWLDIDGRLCTASPPEQEPCEDDGVPIDVNVFPVPTPKFRMWEPPGVRDRIAAGQRVPVRIYYGTQVRWEKPKPEATDLDVRKVVYPPSPKVFRSVRERQPTDVPVVVPVPAKHPVVCQKWEESERGWGCRSNGYTLHLTEGDRKTYVERFMEQQRKDCGPEAPDEYTRPCGTPYVVDVDDATYQKLLEAHAKHGIDGFSVDPRPGAAHPEGQPGPDGWRQGEP